MAADATPDHEAPPVVCVTPNPGVDRISTVESFALGEVNRTQDTQVIAGGKGMNVARALAHLGHEAVCVAPVGGDLGATFVRLADAEELRGDWVGVQGETRTNLTIITPDEATRDTLLNEAGPELDEGEWNALAERVVRHSRAGGPVAISGSVPRGVSAGQLAGLVTAVEGHGSPVYVDSSGWALQAMLDAKPTCVKVNRDEAAGLLGEDLGSEKGLRQAAELLLGSVSGIAIITLGAEGTLVADTSGLLAKIEPVPVEVVSSVGAGDTFLGAFLAGLHGRGWSTLKAARYASAAGAANSMNATQGTVSSELVDSLCESSQVRVLREAG